MSGHSDFGIINNFGASSIFYLGINRYCIRCLSCAPWQSGYDIHDFSCYHLRCWWSLFGEYCVRPRIVFYNIMSEYNSTFVFLVLCLQFSIFQMTYVHQWGKMNFCALRLCVIDHLFLTFDFRQVPLRFFPIFPIPCPLLLLMQEFS